MQTATQSSAEPTRRAVLKLEARAYPPRPAQQNDRLRRAVLNQAARAGLYPAKPVNGHAIRKGGSPSPNLIDRPTARTRLNGLLRDDRLSAAALASITSGDAMVGTRDLCAILNVTRMTLHNWMKNPRLRFPAPVKVLRHNRWRVDEINKFLASKRVVK